MSHKLSRRKFIKNTAVVGAAAGVPSFLPPLVKKARASRDHILIGRPNPTTGLLAGYGEASPWADQRAVAAINQAGGIYIKERGEKLPVKFMMVDTQSDPSKAGDAAAHLILRNEVDLVLVMHGEDTVRPVSIMCERHRTPCISTVVPAETWLSNGPHHWNYHMFWTLEEMAEVYVGMWEQAADRHNKVVGVLWPNDRDGKTWGPIFAKKAASKGYRLVYTGHFPNNNLDFGHIIKAFKEEGATIVCGTLLPADFALFWRQASEMDFSPEMATIGRAIVFPSEVAALEGKLPQGLLIDVWWSPYHPYKSSLTGETAGELCAAWTKETGKPWSMTMGFKYAACEIAIDAIKRAGSLDKNALREAIAQTGLDTMVGPVRFNSDNLSQTSVVGGQWVRGKRFPWDLQIVYNQQAPKIPTTAELAFPLGH